MDIEDDVGVDVRTALKYDDLYGPDSELWLFRMPYEFDDRVMASQVFDFDENKNIPGTVIHTFQGTQRANGDNDGGPVAYTSTDAESYDIQVGSSPESGAFILLAHSEEHGALRAVKPISKSFIISQRIPSASEPNSGASGSSIPMVIPYSRVEQVPDLQVRFKPFGSAAVSLSDRKACNEEEEDKGKNTKKKSKKKKSKKG